MTALPVELGLVAERVIPHVPERVEHDDRDHHHDGEDEGGRDPAAEPGRLPLACGRRRGAGRGRCIGRRRRCRGHGYQPFPSCALMSRSWPTPTMIMMTNRM